jgi:hypothetical protein
MEYLKFFDRSVDSVLNRVIRKTDLVKGVVHLLLMLYAARIAPNLPKQVLLLFENQYFKLFIFSIILWTAQFSPSTSLLISLAFLITVNYANQKPLWEFLENVEQEPSQQQIADAIQTLGEGAVSEKPIPPEEIIPAANVAAAAVKTEDGLNAVKALAEQAMAPSAAKEEQVLEAVKVAAESTVAPPPVVEQAMQKVEVPEVPAPAPPPAPVPVQPKESLPEPAPVPEDQGCYPVRRYDMSKVNPQSFDNYYDWKS